MNYNMTYQYEIRFYKIFRAFLIQIGPYTSFTIILLLYDKIIVFQNSIRLKAHSKSNKTSKHLVFLERMLESRSKLTALPLL